VSLLHATNLAKSFGDFEVFSEISVEIQREARIALVGPNGAGKTTLLNVLIGESTPSVGEVYTMKGLRIGFLPQRPELLGDHTLWEEAIKAFAELERQEAQLHALAEKLATGDADALARYGDIEAEFEANGGYTYLQDIKTVLMGLGFSEADFGTSLSTFSGGQKTRAVLARLLLEAPDLLALDEPTNHLDIQAVEWLEDYLTTFPGGVISISHDRYFIDHYANLIWELEYGALEVYRGNYTHYIRQREERRERQQKEYEAQQAFVAKELDYIRRNIAGQNTRQAQGRRTRLERTLRDNGASGATAERDRMQLSLQVAHRGNEFVIKSKGLQVGYAGLPPVLRVPDLKLERGEIAALIGPNGVGKSTLIKTLLGLLTPHSGEVEVGDKVEVGYFAQAHETLDPNNSVIDEIQLARKMLPAEARHYLAKYLFRGDDVFRKVGSLSGGERGRVALAKLALGTANVLLLDEPTNHLDIPAQEVLEEMLNDYGGTVILISHDRYLVDALATQVWAAIPGDPTGELQLFKGSYSEYVQARQARIAQDAAAAKARDKAAAAAASKANGTTPSSKKHGLNPHQLQKRVAEVEAQIAALEAKQEAINTELTTASTTGNGARVLQLSTDYSRLEGELERTLAEWERLME
jgi:ATP-binding cassette subfamily F protein 3